MVLPLRKFLSSESRYLISIFSFKNHNFLGYSIKDHSSSTNQNHMLNPIYFPNFQVLLCITISNSSQPQIIKRQYILTNIMPRNKSLSDSLLTKQEVNYQNSGDNNSLILQSRRFISKRAVKRIHNHFVHFTPISNLKRVYRMHRHYEYSVNMNFSGKGKACYYYALDFCSQRTISAMDLPL